MWPISSVWPSGAAFATSAAPSEPPAPGLLSTITFWPNAAASFGASARARMSVLPPGVKGTTRRMWRDWASARPAGQVNAAAAPA